MQTSTLSNMYKKINSNLLFYSFLLITGILLLYFSYYNEFCEGGPDNIWHYYFSKYALTTPDFFLHHWGKPLFILFSTWFAQFGFYGIKVFNIICGILSTYFVYKTLCHLNIKLAWFSAPLLLFSPLYFMVMQSSLTEPLFSLILSLVVYLYFINKDILATIVVSFILFSRSEGIFIIPCFAIYLVLIKKWTLLPLLLTGFITYSFLGFFMGHDFLWHFTENPYDLNSPYGHGHYMDILKRYDSIWGLPFLILLCIAFILICYFYIREKQFMFWKAPNETAKITYLVVVPSMAFLGFHLYVWHFGLCGSAGLERVLASTLPMNVLLTIWALNKLIIDRVSNIVTYCAIILFLFFHLQTPFKTFSYPLKGWGAEKTILDATNWFKTIAPKECVIYYTYPNVIFNLDRNPFDKTLNPELFAYKKDCSEKSQLPIYLFWDSVFSESSCGIKVEDVIKCNYKQIKEFTDGGDFRMIVFERIP